MYECITGDSFVSKFTHFYYDRILLIVCLFGLLIVGLDDLMMNDSPSLKKNEWQLTIPFGDIQSFENSGQKRTKHACMAHSQNFTTSTVSIIAYLHTHTHTTQQLAYRFVVVLAAWNFPRYVLKGRR